MNKQITIITKPSIWLILFTVFNAIILIVFLSFYFYPNPRDDSDEPTPDGKYSQMKVRTDYLTGCQYFESSQGSLTPRLDALGNQVGCNAVWLK